MLDTLADISLMLLVGKWRCCLAHGMEIVGMHIGLVHLSVDIVESRFVT